MNLLLLRYHIGAEVQAADADPAYLWRVPDLAALVRLRFKPDNASIAGGRRPGRRATSSNQSITKCPGRLSNGSARTVWTRRFSARRPVARDSTYTHAIQGRSWSATAKESIGQVHPIFGPVWGRKS
jgi:hypothetical protein